MELPSVCFSPEESNADDMLYVETLCRLTNLVMQYGTDIKFCNHINEANCNNLVDIASEKSQYVIIRFMQNTKMDELLQVVGNLKTLHAITFEIMLGEYAPEELGAVPMTLRFNAGEYVSSTCTLLFDKDVTEKSITLHFNTTKIIY